MGFFGVYAGDSRFRCACGGGSTIDAYAGVFSGYCGGFGSGGALLGSNLRLYGFILLYYPIGNRDSRAHYWTCYGNIVCPSHNSYRLLCGSHRRGLAKRSKGSSRCLNSWPRHVFLCVANDFSRGSSDCIGGSWSRRMQYNMAAVQDASA